MPIFYISFTEVIKLADFLQMEHLIKSVSLMISETLGITNVSDISNLVQMKHFIQENMFEMCKKGLLDLLKLHLEDLEDFYTVLLSMAISTLLSTLSLF